jgi:CRISPR-associated protein Cmr1
LRELSVHLEVVTPILGGSHQTRAIDDVDVIRVPSVRGHLRFWWRALYAAQYAKSNALYQRESALWGHAATDDGGRSAVEVRISVKKTGAIDTEDIRLYDSKDGKKTPGAYALWPARKEKQTETPPAPRRLPGTQFRLTLKVAGSATDETEVRNAVRAWILFGGYGGRTRRGLGSLKVIDDVNGWLPTAASREALTNLFGLDIFAPPGQPACEVPWLEGASMHVGPAGSNAQTAWTTALDWLREFRQGTSGARQPDPSGTNQRPSVSNWPEGDKVRQLSSPKKGLGWAHKPRHNSKPAWPRAGFGLPIIGQFQQQSRQARPGWKNGDKKPKYLYWDELSPSHPNYGTEPDGFELRWRSPKKQRLREFDEHDRLASPLIVKALPLADGTFVPCALWLNRSLPNGAQAGLARTKHDGRPNEKEVDPATVAPFDCLVAEGDKALFPALAGKTSLREAFLDWLHTTHKTTVVAP